MGCEITAEIKDGIIEKIAGNNCQRGEVYTREEITAPKITAIAKIFFIVSFYMYCIKYFSKFIKIN